MIDRRSSLKGSLLDLMMLSMPNDDISLILIHKKTGYGLAPRKWRAALESIRALPEARSS